MKSVVRNLGVSCLLFANCGAEAAVDCFSHLIEERHSGYHFDESKKVTLEQIRQMMRAAQLTPSSYNDQPWRFIICNRETNPQAYQKALNCLVEPNQKWAKDAPILIVVCADSTPYHGEESNLHAQYDTGAAAISLVYQATELGLMAHEMGGFIPEKTIKEFSIPASAKPMAFIAVGYEQKEAEHTKKGRKPLEELFFEGTWGKTK